MIQLDNIFPGKKKVVIGMIHFPPLPSAPMYDNQKGINYLKDVVEKDLLALQEGGIDGVMFCNENDRPYNFEADFSTIATMSSIMGGLLDKIEVPFGVDVLWDPKAALAIAKATGARFIREIITGVFVSDMGIWNTKVGELYRYRRLIGADDVAVFFNISAEFAYNLDRRPLEVIAKSTVFSSLSDVILVSGPMTGAPPTPEMVAKVKNEVDVPVFVNTGFNKDNAEEMFKYADGAIVGTSLKYDGITWNQVDPDRVKELMDKVNSIRR